MVSYIYPSSKGAGDQQKLFYIICHLFFNVKYPGLKIRSTELCKKYISGAYAICTFNGNVNTQDFFVLRLYVG